MNTSIMSSFFFIPMVDNYNIIQAKITKPLYSKDFSEHKSEIMSLFSRLYTVMETQAIGLPISEQDLDISSALVCAFSWIWMHGIEDPYLVTELMWQGYMEGDLALKSKNYTSLHSLAYNILKEDKKPRSSNASKSK